MFEAKFAQGTTLKKIVEAIRELCKEVNLDVNETGVQLQAMDSSHVALVSMFLKTPLFQDYRADRKIVLGMSMESVAKILKLCGNDDSVMLRSEEDSDQMSFVFENEKEDRISDFALKLLDIDNEHMGIPENQEYKCVVRMPSSEFQKIMRDLKEFGDSVQISGSKDGVKFSVQGDIGAGNVTVKPRESDKESQAVTIACEDPVNAAYALRYLNFFAKATPLSDTVTLSISDEQPLIAEYEIGDKESGHLRFFLAPKIDE